MEAVVPNDPSGIYVILIDKLSEKFISDGVPFRFDMARTEGDCVTIND